MIQLDPIDIPIAILSVCLVSYLIESIHFYLDFLHCGCNLFFFNWVSASNLSLVVKFIHVIYVNNLSDFSTVGVSRKVLGFLHQIPSKLFDHSYPAEHNS